MLSNFASYGWHVFEYDLNAWFHGSAGARRRLYSVACSERAMQAAMRAGVERPEELVPVPFRDRLVMRDVMLDDATIDGYHAYLYTGHVLSVPTLHGDARDQRQVARVDAGFWEAEPVGDVRLPAMPMKCFGGTPLVMLEDGRVRRLLLSEFAAIGQVPWSVGHGISCEQTEEEVRTAKVMMGNTWDGNLTKKIMGVAVDFVRHLVDERRNEPATLERVAARFSMIVARVKQPARRAMRRWREVCRRASRAAAEWWLPMARRLCILQMRRVGWLGEERIAVASWHVIVRNGTRSTVTALEGQGEAAGMSRSGSVFLSAALDLAMVGGDMKFTKCVAITKDWRPEIRNTATQKRWGTRLALPSEVIDAELHERPLPSFRVPPATSCPRPPVAPSEEEQEAFQARFPDERAVWTPAGWTKLKQWEVAMKRDAEGCTQHGTEGASGYRVRMKSGVPGAELRLTQLHLAVDARGLQIEFDDETGAPRLATPIRMSDRDDCVIELEKLKVWMRKRGWRDRFMLWVCDWGWTDLTASRPFVMSFSPNMKAAYERYDKVCVAHELEIRRKWSKRRKRIPFAGELRIVQTNAVDKSDGSARLLGNATHPEKDTYMCEVDGLPVAPNLHTDWSFLPRFEWATIDRFGEAVAILCAVAHWAKQMGGLASETIRLLVVVGSRDDLEKWFRQIPQYSGDHCKQVYHWGGHYIVDWHVQMGRGSSADGAQRLSMIGGQIVFEAVEQRLDEELRRGTAAGEEPWSTLSRVVEYRRQRTGLTETGLWALDLMQDDLGYVAISMAVGDAIRDTIPVVLAEYGISVSMSKRAEDEAVVEGDQPNQRMLYIGADFYMHDCECPKFRGQDKSLARFEEVMEEWSAYAPGKLVPLLLLQRLIGMCLFHGRFQLRVRRYLNSGIRCIRERSGDHRVMSRAWQRDVRVIFQRAMAREPFPMVQPATWWHPGLFGCNSDASRPQGVADNSRGLGGNVMQFYFFGEWSNEETTLLDISTLELIAVGYLVVVAAMTG